jgi:hypothetical protein
VTKAGECFADVHMSSRRAKGGHGQGFEILILSPDFDFGCLSPRTVAFKKLKFE